VCLFIRLSPSINRKEPPIKKYFSSIGGQVHFKLIHQSLLQT